MTARVRVLRTSKTDFFSISHLLIALLYDSFIDIYHNSNVRNPNLFREYSTSNQEREKRRKRDRSEIEYPLCVLLPCQLSLSVSPSLLSASIGIRSIPLLPTTAKLGRPMLYKFYKDMHGNMGLEFTVPCSMLRLADVERLL